MKNKRMPLSKVVLLDNIKLDVGCGFNKQPGFVGMDRRDVEGVDVIHNIEDIPWPFRADSCHIVLMSHIIEHLNPAILIDIFDEVWRILKPNGQLLVATPYAGSYGAYQDPTHVRPGFNPDTFNYFAIGHTLYEVYRPRPYKVISCNYSIEGNINVVMEALKDNISVSEVTVKHEGRSSRRRLSKSGGRKGGAKCKE